MTDRTLELLVEARMNFYRRWHSPEAERIFLTNELRILDMFDTFNVSNIFSRIATLPLSVFNYNDIPVSAPTVAQLTIGLLPVTEVTPTSQCAICQEMLTDVTTCVRLRNCSHTFHRSCANTWYRRSALCPLCRNDIRTAPTTNTNG